MSLPAFTPNTPSFVDEGTSTTGWTLANCTLSQHDATTVQLTQTALGSQGLAAQAITMPIAGKDWILYAGITARMATGDVQIVQIRGTGTARAHIYLNYNTVTKAPQLGCVSLRHTSAANSTKNAVCATGLDLENTLLDCRLQFDSKNNQLSIHFRDTNGWKFGGQCVGSFFGVEIGVQVFDAVSSGAWVRWDWLELVAPNFQSIGDSLCMGATAFNPASGGDGDNQWQRWCQAYPGLRNNAIVNKGVGGNTSAMVAARIQADVVDNGPRVVFLGSCNNDRAAGISYTQRSANIQSSINAIVTGGAKVVLLNAVYCTSSYPGQPGPRDYSEDYWQTEAPNLTGVDLFVDVMQGIDDASGYQDPALTRSDKIHLTPAGARAYGEYIAAQ